MPHALIIQRFLIFQLGTHLVWLQQQIKAEGLQKSALKDTHDHDPMDSATMNTDNDTDSHTDTEGVPDICACKKECVRESPRGRPGACTPSSDDSGVR